MSDINPLGAASYFSGVQNASSQAAKTNKKEKEQSTSRLKFQDFFAKKEEPSELVKSGYPKEIENLSVEDAAIFLKDRIDEAGDILKESITDENVEKFKQTVQQFVRFVVENNYEVTKKHMKGFSSPLNAFSNYNTKIYPKNPRVQIQVINKQLDELTKGMLYNQKDNLAILSKANEIKGLIVDFLSS